MNSRSLLKVRSTFDQDFFSQTFCGERERKAVLERVYDTEKHILGPNIILKRHRLYPGNV